MGAADSVPGVCFQFADHSFQVETFVKILSRGTGKTRAVTFAAEICAPHVQMDAAKIA